MMTQRVLRKMFLSCSGSKSYIIMNYRMNFSTEEKDDKYKFKIFKDEDSPVILDMEEELAELDKRSKIKIISRKHKVDEKILTRGVTGVFEIQELVHYLKEDNAKDIFVVKVPTELKYVDYFVVVSGKSQRHILGLAEYIRKIFKRKMHSSDILPVIEGKYSSDWIAMDLGNIALHIMSSNARKRYDLESLWTLGSQYDFKTNQHDELNEFIKSYSINLDSLGPVPSVV
ncbi:unnamed protein product [Nezara viridula]|uniref:Mitochondrial assembly of ribosomal large subunit protein 1 n=1 Tax=Nezara viridula TaxID=85310 RepID=A0A9P0MM21_NEZVI|nr:unnamed protein product [Nezara viridula]